MSATPARAIPRSPIGRARARVAHLRHEVDRDGDDRGEDRLPGADGGGARHNRDEQAEERERGAADDGGHGRNVKEHETEAHERVDEDRQPLVPGHARQRRLAGQREAGEDEHPEQLDRGATHGSDRQGHRAEGGGIEHHRVGHEPARKPSAHRAARPQVGHPRRTPSR